jgi:hypothetical protein
MTTPDNLIADVLAAAGGEIVGRIRLQKIFYLLDQMGMASGLAFHYHHYGPYSRQLDDALDRAQAIRGVREAIKYRQVDGMPYSIFSLRDYRGISPSSTIGGLPANKVRDLIGALSGRSSTVLELAATIHWLAEHEGISDWKKELVRRKGIKAEEGRVAQAVKLLEGLGIAPA